MGMIFLVFFSIALSAFTLVIVLKERSRRFYAAELEEFRAETERLIAEFNRVAERNISILDDRIIALERETRHARKAENCLKEQCETYSLLQDEKTDEAEAESLPHPSEAFAYGGPPDKEISTPQLFDGISVNRIKTYAKHRNQPKQKHELLIQYLKESKNKEELLEMGFSATEINLALMALNTPNEESL